MRHLWQDLKYAARMLRKNPGFTAVAVLTLALGIGANTAIFSVVNAMLLRPLPFPQSERLVRVISTLPPINNDSASYPDFLDWRSGNSAFDGMAACRTENFTLTGVETPLHIKAAVVSAELFEVLHVKPVLGRTFLSSEDDPGAANGTNATILSYGLWQSRFGSDEHVVGRTVELSDKQFTVVGVMPVGFQFPVMGEPVDLWTTMAVDLGLGGTAMASQRGAHYLDVIARLKAGATVVQAQVQMSAIVSALNDRYPQNKARGVKVVPELQQEAGPIRPALLMLLAAVGCVVLIACANVATLLLARASTRQEEIAIRVALGASRGRMIRQLLTESILLALVGGALGTILAGWGVEILRHLLPQNIQDVPRVAQIGLDVSVLGFTAILSLATGILFGLVPSLQSSKSVLMGSLKASGRASTQGERHNVVRDVLVAGEIAVAVCLLVGAGLLIRSFQQLTNVEPGFDSHQVLTFNLVAPGRYSQAQNVDLFQQAQAQIGALPGVLSVSAVIPLPLGGDNVSTAFHIEGQPDVPGHNPETDYNFVEPAYFRTMAISLLKGRDFTWQDDLKAQPVVIIDETLAERFFPGQDPVGKHLDPHIGNGYGMPPMREIVGVVQDVKLHSLKAVPGPQVYVPVAQSPLDVVTFVVRTEADPNDAVRDVRNLVHGLDKDLPLFGVKVLDDYVDQAVAQPRLEALLLAIFSGIALGLAVVGIYGIVSYSVIRRTNEIGIRMALGAQRSDVLKMVLGGGMRLALIGVACGIVGALVMGHLLSSFLFGVSPTDPETLVVVPLGLLGVAALACWIPARRAMRVDPMVALRHE